MSEIRDYKGQEITTERLVEVMLDYFEGRRELSGHIDENGDSVCFYRGEGSRCCAIGSFMADENYRPEMENRTVCQLLSDHPEVLKVGAPLSTLNRFQRLHDSAISILTQDDPLKIDYKDFRNNFRRLILPNNETSKRLAQKVKEIIGDKLDDC